MRMTGERLALKSPGVDGPINPNRAHAPVDDPGFLVWCGLC
jgi:hypothetical protein